MRNVFILQGVQSLKLATQNISLLAGLKPAPVSDDFTVATVFGETTIDSGFRSGGASSLKAGWEKLSLNVFNLFSASLGL